MIARRLASLVSVGVLTVSAAACGGSDDADPGAGAAAGEEPSSDAEIDPSDASTYRGELEDGSVLTVRLDVDDSDPVVAPFVVFREQAGVDDDVVWIVGTLDAPADFDDPLGPPTGRYLTFVPPGGELLDESNPLSTFACSELDDWFGEPTAEEGLALNEAYLEILDTSCGGQVLQVVGEIGGTVDYAMVVEGPSLPEFESIYAGLLTELAPAG